MVEGDDISTNVGLKTPTSILFGSEELMMDDVRPLSSCFVLTYLSGLENEELPETRAEYNIRTYHGTKQRVLLGLDSDKFTFRNTIQGIARHAITTA